MQTPSAIRAADAARELAARRVVLLDVREDYELKLASVRGATHLAMNAVPARLAELPRDRPIVVMCHHGSRSAAVTAFLRREGFDARNLVGGIAAWAREVDESVGSY